MGMYVDFIFYMPNHRPTEIKNSETIAHMFVTHMFLNMQINMTFCAEYYQDDIACKRKEYIYNYVHVNNCIDQPSFLKFSFN